MLIKEAEDIRIWYNETLNKLPKPISYTVGLWESNWDLAIDIKNDKMLGAVEVETCEVEDMHTFDSYTIIRHMYIMGELGLPDYINGVEKNQVETVKKCNCDIGVLIAIGCQCGGV